MSSKVEEIYKSLTVKRIWPLKPSEIDEIWQPIKRQLNSEEQMQLLICLSKESYIFPWLKVISSAIPDFLPIEKSFVELIENVVAKVKNDMAQGDFVNSLIELGKKQPEQAIELYKKLSKNEDRVVIQYSGLILGGAAKTDLKLIFPIAKTDFNEGSYPTQVACIRAIRVGLEGIDFPSFSEEVFGILERAIGQNDEAVKIEAIQGYIDFDRANPTVSEEALKSVARAGSSTLRLVIIDRLWLTNLQVRENEIQILKLCAQDNDQRVLESIARVLSKKGSTFLADSMEIIRELVKKPFSIHGTMFDYYLQEFGKDNLASILEGIEQWAKSDKDEEWSFKAAMFLVDFASGENMEELRSALKSWIGSKDQDLQWIAMKTMVELFEKGHFSREKCEEEFSVLKTLMDEPIRSELEGELWSLFSGRPLFVDSATVVRIIRDWANDHDWRVRKTILHTLSSLAETRVDAEETLHLLINKETNQSKVAGITTKKIQQSEGVAAYDLLEQLTRDSEKDVKDLAQALLDKVNDRLNEKEAKLDERISKQTKPDESKHEK